MDFFFRTICYNMIDRKLIHAYNQIKTRQMKTCKIRHKSSIIDQFENGNLSNIDMS